MNAIFSRTSRVLSRVSTVLIYASGTFPNTQTNHLPRFVFFLLPKDAEGPNAEMTDLPSIIQNPTSLVLMLRPYPASHSYVHALSGTSKLNSLEEHRPQRFISLINTEQMFFVIAPWL